MSSLFVDSGLAGVTHCVFQAYGGGPDITSGFLPSCLRAFLRPTEAAYGLSKPQIHLQGGGKALQLFLMTNYLLLISEGVSETGRDHAQPLCASKTPLDTT